LDRDGKAADRRALMFYGVGGAAIIAGAVAFVFLGRSDSGTSANVGLVPTSDGGVVTWTGAF
jgi:hypothetical protein